MLSMILKIGSAAVFAHVGCSASHRGLHLFSWHVCPCLAVPLGSSQPVFESSQFWSDQASGILCPPKMTVAKSLSHFTSSMDSVLPSVFPAAAFCCLSFLSFLQGISAIPEVDLSSMLCSYPIFGAQTQASGTRWHISSAVLHCNKNGTFAWKTFSCFMRNTVN